MRMSTARRKTPPRPQTDQNKARADAIFADLKRQATASSVVRATSTPKVLNLW